eukprot:gb/GECH01005616.1/.p1 GENE.gb/GECH01005616.1/~~gb/GECH01005616.1/.p1  ORF type:complete len:789 (+),score=171.52 gb/GECH01005616.1/:1-2367(+)
MNTSIYEQRRLINEEDESQTNNKKKFLCGAATFWGLFISVFVVGLIVAVCLLYVKPQEVPEFNTLETNLTSVEKQVDSIRHDMAQFQKQQQNIDNSLKSNLTSVESEVQSLRHNLKQFNQQQQKLHEQVISQLNSLESRLGQVNSSCSEHSEENEQQLGQVWSVLGNINETNVKYRSTVESRLNDMNSDISNIREQYHRFNSSTSDSISHLQKEISHDVTSIHDEINHVNSSVSSSVSSLQSQFVTMKTQIAPCSLECHHGGSPNSNCSACEGCDKGWTGTLCQTPANCMTKCKADNKPCSCDHGGVMDKKTCVCSCPTGWMGDYCQNVDPSVPLHKRLEYLEHLLHNATSTSLSASKGNPHLRHHLGTGVTTPQHTLTGIPVLQFEYSNDTWYADAQHQFIVPDNVEFESITGGQYYPESETNVYPDMFNMLEKTRSYPLDGMKSIGPQLVMQKGVKEIYKKYFGGTAFLTVAQHYLPLYKASLPPLLTNSNFKLDPRFRAALNYLPRNFSESGAMDLYSKVFEFWGTEYVETSVEGGVLGMISSVKNSLMDEVSGVGGVVDSIGKNAEADFLREIGEGSSQGMSKSYRSSVTMRDLVCAGGNAPKQSSCSAKHLPNWRKSLAESPYVIKYQTAPISKLIKDPQLRLVWEEALDAYTKQQYQLWKGECIDCAHGKCHPPNQYCECEGNWVGRTCSACAEGFFGPHCKQKLVKAVIGPGKDKKTITKPLASVANHRCYMTGIKNLCLSGDCNIIEKGGNWEMEAQFYGLRDARCKVNRVECYATCEQI